MSDQEPGKVQKAKGMAKQFAGTVTRSEGLRAQGRADRQEPADEELRRYFRKVIEESNIRSTR